MLNQNVCTVCTREMVINDPPRKYMFRPDGTMYLRGISSPCIAWNTIHEIDFYPVLQQHEFTAESIHCFEVA